MSDAIDSWEKYLGFMRKIETGAAESESRPAGSISKELQNFAPQHVKCCRIMIFFKTKNNIPDPKRDFIDVKENKLEFIRNIETCAAENES